MTCLLKVYVLASDSGVLSRNAVLGTNQRSDALREQMEQLQARPLSISPSTSNAMAPQWQLPVCVVMISFFKLVEFLGAEKEKRKPIGSLNLWDKTAMGLRVTQRRRWQVRSMRREAATVCCVSVTSDGLCSTRAESTRFTLDLWKSS